eukprot:gb/GECH01009845.1/.p1 GENE.gb/GECH01009845.1/~~gb/GECH01009845.1/.p1  ORF type:complete len:251 (+),score=33.17 gb/GECH01009845.1/:1-753(+)
MDINASLQQGPKHPYYHLQRSTLPSEDGLLYYIAEKYPRIRHTRSAIDLILALHTRLVSITTRYTHGNHHSCFEEEVHRTAWNALDAALVEADKRRNEFDRRDEVTMERQQNRSGKDFGEASLNQIDPRGSHATSNYCAPTSTLSRDSSSGIDNADTIPANNFHHDNIPHPNPDRDYHPTRHLPGDAIQVLQDWFIEHWERPYPNDEEKEHLAQQTGLTAVQVGNWFINTRVRVWRPLWRNREQQEKQEQ